MGFDVVCFSSFYKISSFVFWRRKKVITGVQNVRAVFEVFSFLAVILGFMPDPRNAHVDR